MAILLSLPETLVAKFHGLTSCDKNHFFVSSDPAGIKVGSGGGTAWLLSKHFKQSGKDNFEKYTASEKKIIIHAGGQSRRLPAYAPSGKLLTPIPVFRWSRGQNINQTLLDLQLPLYEQLINNAPNNLNTLIASGDVYILAEKAFNNIPEADIVCLAMWVEPHLASKHGVFFSPRESPQFPDFILQKPSHQQIEQLASTHLFLMDAGVWLLSDKAVDVLMKKCGWANDNFNNDIPCNYDLYGTFGTCLGRKPSQFDAEISQLSIEIITIENGEFFHYGTNKELITSTEKIQNHIKDQRTIWHHKVKPHPSIFVQNSITKINWTDKHHNIWIENSCIPAGWKISNDHIITGIPENNWNISFAPGFCLDMIPFGDAEFIIRPYGMKDTFGGEVKNALWMDIHVTEWLKSKNITCEEAGISIETDIQLAPLFPVIEFNDKTEFLIKWFLGTNDMHEEMRTLWLNSNRLSASDISRDANLERLFAQREIFFKNTVPHLAANYKKSVLYQVDLKKLAKDYACLNIDMPEPLPTDENPLLLVRDFMFRSEILRNKNMDGSNEAQKAFVILRNNIINSSSQKVHPELNIYPDQIVWGRSPARLDLAGGWSDTPPYCIQSGGSVVNVGVNLNGQPPLQVFIRLSTEYRIVLRSIDNGVSEIITTYDELGDYSNVGSAFSIPKAALCLAGFHPKSGSDAFKTLEEMLKSFGGGIEISLLVAIPKGSGLGTSSILAATILGALSDLCGLNWDKQTICHRTLILEQMLTTGGGWQDQFGGVFPGIKLLQSAPGLQTNINVNWLPDMLFTSPDFKNNWLLYYTGITRVAKNILAEIVRGMFLNEGSRLQIINSIKEHAYNMFGAIQTSNYEQAAKMINGRGCLTIDWILEPIRPKYNLLLIK